MKAVEWAPGYFVTEDGSVVSRRRIRERVLRPGIVNGYEQVILMVDGQRHQVKVHALVCEAFNGPRPAGLQCRHRDGNKRNNKAANLTWGTAAENAADRSRHRGRYARPRVPLSVAIKARRAYLAGEGTQREIGRRLGVSREFVWAAVNKKMRRMDNDQL